MITHATHTYTSAHSETRRSAACGCHKGMVVLLALLLALCSCVVADNRER